MYRDYLEKCMPSVMMQTYLKTVELADWQIVDLIMYAPVSIGTKLEELRKVYADAKERQDEELLHKSYIGIRNIEEAIHFLKTDGVFIVEPSYFDEETKDTEGFFDNVCASIEDVQEYIRNDLEIGEIEPEALKWYGISKWAKNASGKYVEACRYIIARDEIIYSEVDDGVSELDYPDIYNISMMANLNVPVPFRVGDLLEFNGYPFGPKCHVLILDIGDNWDCCCVQGLALDDKGLWTCGAVKHGMVSLNYFPKISYLYSAKLYDGELEANERILLTIKDYIRNDEQVGRKIYEAIWAGHMTDEELLGMLPRDVQRSKEWNSVSEDRTTGILSVNREQNVILV